MKVKFFLWISVIVVGAACGGKDDKNNADASKDSTATAAAKEPAPIDTTAFTAPVSTELPKEETVFRFNLPKGKRYEYKMVMDASNEGEGRKINTEMKWTCGMNVTDDRGGIKTILVTYRQIEMAMDMGLGGQKMEFSSEKKVEGNDLMQMPSKMFGAIKGKSFTMKVDGKGEIVAVEGFDKIGEAIVNEMNVPENQKAMMLQNFKQQFNDRAAKEMFSQGFEIFPDKPVKIGDSWTKPTQSMGGEMKLKTSYTVRNISNGKVYLDANSKIDTGDPKSTGSQSGKMIVDARTGLVVDASINNKLSGERTITTKTRITSREL